MEKKIYYTVELDVTSSDRLSGTKEVTVYEIIDNKPKMIVSIELENWQTSDAEIEKHFNENGLGDDNYSFERL